MNRNPNLIIMHNDKFSTRPNETKNPKTDEKVKLRTNKSSRGRWRLILDNLYPRRSFSSAFNLALYVCFNICHTSKCFSICQWNFLTFLSSLPFFFLFICHEKIFFDRLGQRRKLFGNVDGYAARRLSHFARRLRESLGTAGIKRKRTR